MSDHSRSSKYDAVIVGAGFGGLYALHRLRALGLSALVLEAGGGLGGTWYWNRYPGARCDVESLQYSYSFADIQQEWNWSERFASQGEILRYANFVADKLDLRKDIAFGTRVTSATYVENDFEWEIGTQENGSLRCRFLIFATGCLSVPLDPVIQGLESFKGRVLRTSTWPDDEVDLSGQVAVVGTGSSGIQAIPMIAGKAAHLYVMQRTPNYSVPGNNGPMTEACQRDWKANYRERRAEALKTRSNNLFNAGTVPGRDIPFEEREHEFERRWQTGGLGFVYAYPDITTNPEVNQHASDFVRRKVAEKIRDPKVADRLLPTAYNIGGRRLCVDNGYYETFNRSNVTLVDLRSDPFGGLTERGFGLGDAEILLDTLVLATGFDAFTGALGRIDVRGRNALLLRDKWSEDVDNYLGLSVAGFPNMFVVTGPGSPSVLSNMITAIEQHVGWIADCIAFVRDSGSRTIEPDPASERQWMEHLGSLLEGTLLSRTKSWYTGSNVPGKKNKSFLYVGGTPRYAEDLHKAGRGSEYSGFVLR